MLYCSVAICMELLSLSHLTYLTDISLTDSNTRQKMQYKVALIT